MGMTAVADLFAALRALPLLTAAQFDQIARHESARGDARTCARELLRRGWLTAYQANQILQGRGDELVLGSYLLLERLGEGGMGQVFKARQLRIDRVVALKVIRKEKLDRPEAIRRFRREIQAAAALKHPNVVAALDADRVGNCHFFVMEYVEGVDLSKLLRDSGPLPVRAACEYVRQAALGLQHAYEQGIVHRDIKPANLLVAAQTGVVKILDMGLARIDVDGGENSSTALTQEGLVVGTVDYLAPEQAVNSHGVDVRADLYSLGCTFYHLLTGQVPFAGGGPVEKLLRHRDQEPTLLRQLRPDVPPAVADLIRRLMAKRPEERFQTPAEVATALAGIMAALSGAAIPVLPPPPTPQVDLDTADGWAAVVATPVVPRQEIERDRATRARQRRLHLYASGSLLVLSLLALAVLFLSMFSRLTPRPRSVADDDAGLPTEFSDSPAVWLRQLRKQAEDPEANREPLRQALRDFLRRHYATPEAKQAAALLQSLPSALDRAEAPRPRLLLERFPAGPARDALVTMFGERRFGLASPVWHVAIRADSRLLASAGQENVIRLWEGSSPNAPVRVLAEHKGSIRALAFAPDGRTLASGGQDGVIKLWDPETGQERALLEPGDEAVLALAFSPDGALLASGGKGDVITLWDTATGARRGRITGHSGSILTLAFAPDGRVLASGSADHSVRLWEVGGEEPRFLTRDDHESAVPAVAFSPDGAFLAHGGDGALRLSSWSNRRLRPQAECKGQRTTVKQMAFLPDGSALLAADRDGLVFWEPRTGDVATEWSGLGAAPLGSMHGFALSAGARHLATCHERGMVCVFRYPVKKE